jgi:peptidoglycan/LPS O-acetylase OafA/YrhL
LRSQSCRRFVSMLGDASYCLYLFHGFFFVALFPLLKHAKAAPLLMLVALMIVVVSSGCVLIHLFIEKPLNRRLMHAYKHRGLARAIV